MSVTADVVPAENAAAARAAARERWHTRINRSAGYSRAGRARLVGAADPHRRRRQPAYARQGAVAGTRRAAVGDRHLPRRLGLSRAQGEDQPRPLAGTGCRSGSKPAISGPTISPSATRQRAFYERQEKRNAETIAKDPNAEARIRPYTGKPTFIDQIITSACRRCSPASCSRRSSQFRSACCAACS